MHLFAPLVLIAVVVLPGVASATVGGPTVVEVLGYAPVDRKIYWLEDREDSSDELPQLWFMRTDGAQAGKPIAVRSWYPPDPRAVTHDEEEGIDVRFEARVERLRRHLVPMTETTERWRVDTEILGSRTWSGEKFGFGERPEHTVRCTPVHTSGSALAPAVDVTVYEKPEVDIAGAFEGPSPAIGIVVLRHLGDPYETGYEVDTVVPVRAATMSGR